MNMETQENFNKQVIGSAALKEWTAPEIKILDSGNTKLGGDDGFDASDRTNASS